MTWSLPKRLTGSVLLSLLISSALAANAPISASWFTIDKKSGEESVELSRGGTVSILTAIPARLFALAADAAAPRYKATVPAGTLFMPAGNAADRRVCEAERHLGSAYWCLADTDNDGRFETYSEQQVFNELYFGSAYSQEHITLLAEPVTLVELDTFQTGPKAELKLSYQGGSENGPLRFKTCIKAKSASAVWKPNGLYGEKCSEKAWEVAGQGFPREFEFYGTRIIARGFEHGKLSLTIVHKPNVSTATFVGSL